MANKQLKIENLENLQELNAEEFSSIQGGEDVLLDPDFNIDPNIDIDINNIGDSDASVDSFGNNEVEPLYTSWALYPGCIAYAEAAS